MITFVPVSRLTISEVTLSMTSWQQNCTTVYFIYFSLMFRDFWSESSLSWWQGLRCGDWIRTFSPGKEEASTFYYLSECVRLCDWWPPHPPTHTHPQTHSSLSNSPTHTSPLSTNMLITHHTSHSRSNLFFHALSPLYLYPNLFARLFCMRMRGLMNAAGKKNGFGKIH